MGAYGRAVNAGQSWQTILDAYYGGTVAGTLAPGERPMSVRLTGWDNTADFGVVDGSGNVIVNGVPRGYPSIAVEDIGANRFRIWGTAARQCPNVPTGWAMLEDVTGPVTLTTFADETTAAPQAGLAACEDAGTLIHYRGAIDVVDVAGATASSTASTSRTTCAASCRARCRRAGVRPEVAPV